MKKNNKKGFTLAELLIVVAIVGVLVAISIPIFSGKLEKAKVATNQANIRAAKAAAVADYLTGESSADADAYYLYDIEKGTVEPKNNANEIKVDEPKDKIYKKIGVKIEKDQTIKTAPHFEGPKLENLKKELGTNNNNNSASTK